MKVSSTFNKYNKVPTRKKITGQEAAQMLLDSGKINGVSVYRGNGKLTDHFDPVEKLVVLSPDVYNGHSVGAVGVAAHEIGHVFQYNSEYAPIKMRAVILPAASIGSNLGFVLVFIGLFINMAMVVNFGILFFSVAVLFSLLTLPVEFNASSRAVILLLENGIITAEEEKGVREVLNAAALTYVAATITAILQLAYLIIQSRRR